MPFRFWPHCTGHPDAAAYQLTARTTAGCPLHACQYFPDHLAPPQVSRWKASERTLQKWLAYHAVWCSTAVALTQNAADLQQQTAIAGGPPPCRTAVNLAPRAPWRQHQRTQCCCGPCCALAKHRHPLAAATPPFAQAAAVPRGRRAASAAASLMPLLLLLPSGDASSPTAWPVQPPCSAKQIAVHASAAVHGFIPCLEHLH